MEIDNIQGNPKAFFAAYAKDLVVARITSGQMVDPMELWKYYYDEMMAHCFSGPITDGQKQYIDSLISNTSLPDHIRKRIEALFFTFTQEEARKTIELLKENQRDNGNMSKTEVNEKVKSMADKDDFYDRKK